MNIVFPACKYVCREENITYEIRRRNFSCSDPCSIIHSHIETRFTHRIQLANCILTTLAKSGVHLLYYNSALQESTLFNISPVYTTVYSFPFTRCIITRAWILMICHLSFLARQTMQFNILILDMERRLQKQLFYSALFHHFVLFFLVLGNFVAQAQMGE